MKTKHRKRSQGGFTLIVVLSFIAAMSTSLAMLAFSSSQRIHTAKRLTQQIKAKAMAEAGCEHGYAQLKATWATSEATNSSAGSSASASASTASDGTTNPGTPMTESYTVDIEPVNPYARLVTSTGSCGSVTSVSIVSVQKLVNPITPAPVLDEDDFKYAILCGGNFSFRGCGSISSSAGTALFHANGTIDNRGNTAANINLSSSTRITSGKVTFGGDITAPSFGLHQKANVLGSKTQKSVATVTIPNIDLTPYYNWAQSHGEVKTGSFSTSGSYTPNGGILWVEGDFHASSWADINGSVIATGNIHVSGHVDVNPTSCAFGLVSRDGDIQVTSGGVISGLLYAKTGDLQHTANGVIQGQIIVNGNIHKAGNSDILNTFVQSIPSVPGGTAATTPPLITAWQK